MPPNLAHGKICYLLIPAIDAAASSEFYQKVFGWRISKRSNGQISFDDGVREVSGTWIAGMAPIDAGFLHIMTDDADRTCKLVVQEGGKVVKRSAPGAREVTALFKDPAGNLFGLYQEPSLKQ